MSQHYEARGPVGALVNGIEETIISALLGVMTLLTFVNVVLRYGFNHSIIWSLEVVLTLFAWLVLFGVAYAFKVTSHLGVDAVTNILSPGPRKTVALIAGVLCIAYALLFLKGAYDYWAPFADLPPTSGRWFPTGFDMSARSQSYFETDQIPIPFEWFKTWLETTFNSYEQGGQILTDEYSKMPRLVPYTMLPVAAVLILFRIVQAVWRIWTDRSPSLIVSHEAEDAVAEAALLNRDN